MKSLGLSAVAAAALLVATGSGAFAGRGDSASRHEVSRGTTERGESVSIMRESNGDYTVQTSDGQIRGNYGSGAKVKDIEREHYKRKEREAEARRERETNRESSGRGSHSRGGD